MADEVVRTSLEAEDNTAGAFRSAIANERALAQASESTTRAIERAARRAGISIEDYTRRMQARSRAAQEAARSEQDAARAAQEQTRATENADRAQQRSNNSLISMARNYLSMAAAIRVAQQSFVQFGEIDGRMRRLQVQTYATADSIKQLMPGLNNLSTELKKPLEELVDGFTMLRREGRLNLEQTAEIFPRVARAAKGMGVETKAMSEVFGALMSNMHVGGRDAVKVMDMLQSGVNHFNLDADELVRSMPRLTVTMREWGYAGVEGVQRMLSHIAAMRPAFASTGEAADGLVRILQHADNDKVARRIGMETRAMMDTLRRAGAEGHDVMELYLTMLDKAVKNGLRMEDIEDRQRRVIIALRSGIIDRTQAYNMLGRAVGEVDRANQIMGSGAKATWDDLKTSVSNLGTELGNLLAKLDAALGSERVTLLGQIAERIRDLQKLLQGDWGVLGKLIEGGFLLAPKGPDKDWSARKGQQLLERFGNKGAPIDPPATSQPQNMPQEYGPVNPSMRGPNRLPFQKMSYDPEREAHQQNITLADIRELLRQIRDTGAGGRPQVQNASYGPGGGDAATYGGPGGGSYSGGGSTAGPGGGMSRGGLPSSSATPPVFGGGRFNGLGGRAPGGGGSAAVPPQGQGGGASPPPASGGGGYPMPSGGITPNAPTGGKPDYLPPISGTRTMEALGATPEQWNAFRRGVTSIESNYGKANRMGGSSGRFAGMYQMGMIGREEVSGTAKLLGEKNPTPQEFLGDKRMQDRFFDAYTAQHHKQLMAGSPRYRSMSPEQKLQVLGYAHNQGVGSRRRMNGAIGWLEGGREGRDAWGTSGTAYSKAIGREMRNAAPSTPPVAPPPTAQQPTTPLVPDPGDRGEAKSPEELRAELSRPITIQARMEGGESQFRRSSISREVSREVRDARASSYADIGAA